VLTSRASKEVFMKKLVALAFLLVLGCGDSTKPADNPSATSAPTSSGAAAPADSAAPAASK
jgi:predicted outer membrane protein